MKLVSFLGFLLGWLFGLVSQTITGTLGGVVSGFSTGLNPNGQAGRSGAAPGVIAAKIKPNVLAIAGMLTAIEFMLTAFLFILVLRIIELAGELANTLSGTAEAAAGEAVAVTPAVVEILLTGVGVAALFSAWLIIIGTIVGGLVSVMAQAAEEKPDKPDAVVPASFAEKALDSALKANK